MQDTKTTNVEEKREASDKQADSGDKSKQAFQNEYQNSLASSKDSKGNSGEANSSSAKESLPALCITDVPTLSPGELTSLGKGILAKVDRDGSGTASKEELAQSLQDSSIKGKDAQALGALYQRFDSINKLDNDAASGISSSDLDVFAKKEKDQWQRADSINKVADEWSKSNFKTFDKDGSGSLTKQEVEAGIADSKTSQADRDALSGLAKLDIINNPKGVSAEQIDAAQKKVWSDTEDAKLVLGAWQTENNISAGQKAKISGDLFADKNNPLKSINPEAISQGSLGDCYFVASLASLAKSNPQIIKDSIKDNGDGTYTVTFPGAKDEPMTVKAPTEAERGIYNRATEHGTWASVMEKAYGQYCQQHWYRRGPFQDAGMTPAEGAEGGGIASRTMALLTDNSIDTDELFLTRQSTVARKLEEAFKNSKSVTAGTNQGIFAESSADNFALGHVYSVTNFAPDGNGGGQITIRNPWGKDAGKESTRGTITMSLDKFMKNFSDISYEQ